MMVAQDVNRLPGAGRGSVCESGAGVPAVNHRKVRLSQPN